MSRQCYCNQTPHHEDCAFSSKLLLLVGDKVKHKWSHKEIGTVIEIEEGCNGLYQVDFNEDFKIWYPRQDLLKIEIT